MHITVIVPAYNVAPYVHEAIASVLSQSYSDLSIFIVDDGSSDETAQVVRSFQDHRVCLIQQQNGGVSSARNTGIRAALAPMTVPASILCTISDDRIGPAAWDGGLVPDAFLFLDSDDWLAPDALAVLAETLESAPWAVAAIGRYGRVGAGGRSRLSSPPADGSILERLLIGNLFANGGHVLIRREAVETAGLFRSDLSYGEDWEYWTRLALLGEFVASRSRAPVLFVRERPGSSYLSHATDPAVYRRALDAIYENPALASRLGTRRLTDLRRRAEAETAWSIGRELARHGNRKTGLRWLARSIRRAPNLKRLGLLGLSGLRVGPFRPYCEVF